MIRGVILGALIGVWLAGAFTGHAHWRLLTEAQAEAGR
jgi:hypothetical protein